MKGITEKPQPPWIKCSEQMPPDDDREILISHPKVNNKPLIVFAFQCHINKSYGFLDDEWEWCEYTKEIGALNDNN